MPRGPERTWRTASGSSGHTADDAPAAPGDLRKINLFWQAVGQPPEDAVAFVQLLDGRDAVVAGWEAPPGAGYPTSAWTPGTLIRTQAALRIPAGLPDGRYRLIAGLYRAGDESRILTTGRDDHLSLGEITLRDRPHEHDRAESAASDRRDFR